MFISKSDIEKAEELGALKKSATAEAASKLADYIVAQKLQPSTLSRKLTQIRQLMREAGVDREVIKATFRPDVTKSAQENHFKKRAGKAPLSKPALYSTGAKLLDRIELAARHADDAVKESATIADLIVAIAARPNEMQPGVLSLKAKRRGRGIGQIMVSGMLKKRGNGDAMPLVSIIQQPKHRAALMKLWNAFRSLPESEQKLAVSNVRHFTRKMYGMLLKDLRNIGADLAVAAHNPKTGVETARVRAGALRHVFDEARLPTTITYDNVGSEKGKEEAE